MRTLRRILRQLIPPIFFTVWRKLTGKPAGPQRPVTFDGMYPTLAAVPIQADKAIYENPEILGLLRAEVEDDLAFLKSYTQCMPPQINTSESPMLLPQLVATVAEQEKRTIRVLDFGGGLGTAYRNCIRMLPASVQYEFIIVELPDMVDIGNDVFADYANVTFCEDLAAVSGGDIDIVNIGSSLEYIEEYKALLDSLNGFKAKHVLFTDMFFYGGETYATRQKNFAAADSFYWMFGFPEIEAIMQAGGYRQIYASANLEIQTFANVPEDRQIPNSSNVLFLRD